MCWYKNVIGLNISILIAFRERVRYFYFDKMLERGAVALFVGDQNFVVNY